MIFVTLHFLLECRTKTKAKEKEWGTERERGMERERDGKWSRDDPLQRKWGSNFFFYDLHVNRSQLINAWNTVEYYNLQKKHTQSKANCNGNQAWVYTCKSLFPEGQVKV